MPLVMPYSSAPAYMSPAPVVSTGIDSYTFDGKRFTAMHHQGTLFAKRQRDVFGVLVNLCGAVNRVRLAG